MPTILDHSLARLADTAEPAALADLDARVLRRIAADRAARGAGLSMAGIAALGAVTLGVLAAGPVATPAAAGGIGPDMALAPSTLLTGR